MPVEKTCEVCGKPYSVQTSVACHSRFCSLKCRSKTKRASRKPRVMKVCPRCKADFTVPHSHAARQKYCSKRCRIDPVSRFFEKISQVGNSIGCWIWIGTRAGSGYGALKVNNQMVSAHRFSWELHHKEKLTPETYLCHRCDNPLCVNPEHLFKGNAAVNMADRDAKERQARGEKIRVSKLTAPQVSEAKKMLIHGVPQAKIAEALGVSQMAISMISQGKTWKHVPWPK